MTSLIAVHAFAALTALLLGAWQLFLSRKGTPAHRIAGRVWVAAMLFVAVSSFWVQDLQLGQFSFLHILSVVTIVTVSLGVWDATRGNIASHRGNMTGSWIGLAFAFVFAVAIPQRAVPTFVVTQPIGAAFAFAAILMTAALVIGLARVLESRIQPAMASASRRTGP